ncbi:MAG: hypothetical protein Q4G66_10765 [bacterium]|nr:hypothetical protein [bacterium]
MMNLIETVYQTVTQGQCAWIYAAILLCLAAQIGITAITLMGAKSPVAVERALPFAEWAINVPPSLGVLGTIVALASALNARESLAASEFVTVFMQNFQDAVGTTVIGGLVYALNLLLYALAEAREQR